MGVDTGRRGGLHGIADQRRGWLAVSTIRGYHLTLRLFCGYVTGARYEWPVQRQDRFGTFPVQVCNEWNTVAHMHEYGASRSNDL